MDISMGSPEPFDTHWGVILAFNSLLYLCLSIFTCCLLLGTFHGYAWPLCCVGGCGHTFGSCVHLACVIVTGNIRFSDEGKYCAENEMQVDGNTTFKDQGK